MPARRTCPVLVAAVCLSLAAHLCGVARDLPFAPEIDEAVFVERAAAIARTGDLNPGWFGHPGSTTIYPLAALFRAAAAFRVFDLAPPGWRGPRTGDSDVPPGYYLLGRLLSVLYGVMSVPLVYLVGRRAFGARIGLAGAWLFSLCPLAVQYGRIVRSDSAALFFGMLALAACLGVYDRPGMGRRCLAGACIGLAIASRYFMVVLIPVLLMVDAAARLRRGAGSAGGTLWAGAAAGLLSAFAAFALSTPYFFIDFAAVRSDLALQADPSHLGCDGLGFAGNLAWYATKAAPAALTWPQAFLVPVGIACILRRREPKQLILLGYAAVFLFALCLSGQHWERWIIQIVPVLSLSAACAAWACAGALSGRAGEPRADRGILFAALVLALLVLPAGKVAQTDIRGMRPSTEILARAWALRNLPAGSRVAQEWYTAPLCGAGFTVEKRFTLAEGRTLDDYEKAGFRVVMASSKMYGRYYAEPRRYPREISFYEELSKRGTLLARFEPSWARGGAVVLIYELPAPESERAPDVK